MPLFVIFCHVTSYDFSQAPVYSFRGISLCPVWGHCALKNSVLFPAFAHLLIPKFSTIVCHNISWTCPSIEHQILESFQDCFNVCFFEGSHFDIFLNYALKYYNILGSVLRAGLWSNNFSPYFDVSFPHEASWGLLGHFMGLGFLTRFEVRSCIVIDTWPIIVNCQSCVSLVNT